MKRILYLLVTVSVSCLGQVNSGYLNKEQKENIWNLYKQSGVKAVLENRVKEGETSGYSIELLDSLGRIRASFGFNDQKELTGNTVYLFDDLNQLIRTERFSGNEILMINEYFDHKL